MLAGSETVLVHNCGVGSVESSLPVRGDRDPTVGQVVDIAEDGTATPVGHQVRSGGGAIADQIDAYLSYVAPDYPRSGGFNAATHVEAKIAWHMVSRGRRSVDLVINHRGGPCPGPYSCQTAVPLLLPVGYELRVHYRGDDGVMTMTRLRGRA
ncbi:DddA-like double-stranded DNA deaminase toxin [Streptomyces sp. F-3]|uniref:DddA-like double-stranded DNA deaminase toxin n=1 Tax=Streptomyces sp. F-3 TaxID=1840095 RepID=UPI003FA764EF